MRQFLVQSCQRSVAGWLTSSLWTISVVACHFDLAWADDAATRQVMMLSTSAEDPARTNDEGQTFGYSISWIREIFRQNVLMIAREEFGLATRDETLGEPVDAESPECFHLTVLPWEGGDIEIQLRRGDETVMEAAVRNNDNRPLERYRRLPERALDLKEKTVSQRSPRQGSGTALDGRATFIHYRTKSKHCCRG